MMMHSMSGAETRETDPTDAVLDSPCRQLPAHPLLHAARGILV
jgi:hypothetical protein